MEPLEPLEPPELELEPPGAGLKLVLELELELEPAPGLTELTDPVDEPGAGAEPGLEPGGALELELELPALEPDAELL